METFSALLAICAGNSPVSGEFPAQRLVTRSFDMFFDLRLNKRLSKQSWGWWFETLLCPLWRQCDVSPRRCGSGFKIMIFTIFTRNDSSVTNKESTLVLVVAWCLQVRNHYLSQCWPRFMSPHVDKAYLYMRLRLYSSRGKMHCNCGLYYWWYDRSAYTFHRWYIAQPVQTEWIEGSIACCLSIVCRHQIELTSSCITYRGRNKMERFVWWSYYQLV